MKTVVLVGDKDNIQFFTKSDSKTMNWLTENAKEHRVFASQGKFVTVSSNGKSPHDELMIHFFIEVAGLLEKNPPLFFDIERHTSGVDIVKLQSGKTYDCNFVAEATSGGPLPDTGHYSAQKSAFIISLLAYKNCFDILKKFGEMKKANEFARRYTALLESQDQSQLFFYFGDAV